MDQERRNKFFEVGERFFKFMDRKYPQALPGNGVLAKLVNREVDFISYDVTVEDPKEMELGMDAIREGLRRGIDLNPDNQAFCWEGFNRHRGTYLEAAETLIEQINHGQIGRIRLVENKNRRINMDRLLRDDPLLKRQRLLVEGREIDRATSIPEPLYNLKRSAKKLKTENPGVIDRRERKTIKRLVEKEVSENGVVSGMLLAIFAQIPTKEIIDIFNEIETKEKKPAWGRKDKINGEFLDEAMLARASKILMGKIVPDTTKETMDEIEELFKRNKYEIGDATHRKVWVERVKTRALFMTLKDAAIEELDKWEPKLDNGEKRLQILQFMVNHRVADRLATTRLTDCHFVFSEEIIRWL